MTGVRNTDRLRAVIEADLGGHLHDEGFDAVVATLRIACGVPMAAVNIVSAGLQTYAAELGLATPCTTVPDALSFCAEVVNSGNPLQVVDASEHPVYARNPLVQSGLVSSYAGEPLLDDGYVIGTVSIFDSRARHFTSTELEILRHQALLASSVLALRRSARTDFLTGLPNRRLFYDRLGQALDRLEHRGGLSAVMYLDIDEFKAINDALGHSVGDGVLMEMARRLTAVMRPTDTLARFGGDEFAATCEDLHSIEDVQILAARMIATTADPWIVHGHVIAIGISIGIAVAVAATPSTNPDGLIRDADAAMYRAKQRPGSTWVLSTSRPR
ncbi:diguanylate cyclase domain-containing protein [Pengzhenrongella phosphoraccumulans]|uniref:diguanylate cyclase domain-containing protein n=1 Tax=Pengzhenrongella phosphoraccumulans TaxID=3114394 RepID=UPI00388E96BF